MAAPEHLTGFQYLHYVRRSQATSALHHLNPKAAKMLNRITGGDACLDGPNIVHDGFQSLGR
jgi:hypothetical protein